MLILSNVSECLQFLCDVETISKFVVGT